MRYTRENRRAAGTDAPSDPGASALVCTEAETPPLRQLDQRTGDGLTVTLEWDSETNHLHVRVQDDRSPDKPPLCFAVEPRDARVAFLHPFAYA
jgi:hypothetical protein